jgi:hypothetical protein
MKLSALSAIVAATVIFSVQGAEPVPAVQKFNRTYELGPGGLISNWLVLGNLPGIQPAEKDRLNALGGEEKVTPYGGQTVVIPTGVAGANLTLTWKVAQVQNPELPWLMINTKGLYLFLDEKGIGIEKSVAYTYCNLESSADQNLGLSFIGGEKLKIWLNGENIPYSGRDTRRSDWTPTLVPVSLKKGQNRLLVRVDNTTEDEFFSARLVRENTAAAANVKVMLPEIKEPPSFGQMLPGQDWEATKAEIPPLAKSHDELFFGANLSRTMTLLESGGQTKRPVRVIFYGQSITASSWTWLLTRRLRELYPDTEIQAENWAISGWGIDKLNRTIKHDVLRARPDLVVLHAYAYGSWEWERIIQAIRRETTAEIVIRSAHIDRGMKEQTNEDSMESILLRRLARTYGCELVECRKEWRDYLAANKLNAEDFLADGLHLNRKGSILMAQLYARHFKRFPISKPWTEMVRRYEAMRPLADRRNDEVQLIGDGWSDRAVNSVTSTGGNDSLKLKFYGNRIDLVMPAHNGSAKVLIDGKAPSELNLFQGTRPQGKGEIPADLMTYYTGPNMLEESWELKFTHISGDHQKYRWTLAGSKTGPDGEGDNSKIFISNSGRITIRPEDFLFSAKGASKEKKVLEPVQGEVSLKWNIPPTPYKDEVSCIPLKPEEAKLIHNSRYDVFYRYVTVVDGLPEGEHELTLIPTTPNRFSIDAIEVHRPPLWVK